MMDSQQERIRESLRCLSSDAGDFYPRFLARLMAAHPPLRAILPRDAAGRSQEFMALLGMVAKNLHRLETLEFLLADIGARAHRAGLQPHHLGLGRSALVSAMRETLGPSFTDEHAADWTDAANAAISIMLRGAGRERAKAA